MTSITEIGSRSPTSTFNNLLFICCIYGLIFIKCSENSVLGETRFNVGLGGLYTYSIYSGLLFTVFALRTLQFSNK